MYFCFNFSPSYSSETKMPEDKRFLATLITHIDSKPLKTLSPISQARSAYCQDHQIWGKRAKWENLHWIQIIPYVQEMTQHLISSHSSFYNWETQSSQSNATPNYQVIAENATGLLFKNKRDRKILNVDPKVRKNPHTYKLLTAN